MEIGCDPRYGPDKQWIATYLRPDVTQHSPLRIDNRVARDLWLERQGLGAAPTGPLDLLGTIKRLGFVQLDTIQYLARAHDHILWSRNQKFRPAMLEELLARDRGIFEHFTHDASVIPMDFLPMWARQFRRKKDQLDRSGWYKTLPDEAARARIKDRIRDEGALSTHAFDTKVEGPRQMWARPPHKIALDYMWYTGELATCHRVNFTKFYDLAERVFPAGLAGAGVPDAAQVDWLCRAALERMGFGAAGDIQRFWDAVGALEVRDWLKDQETSVQPVEVETADGNWVSAVAPQGIEDMLSALAPPTSRLRILNPFDPAVRDRNRLERLFGFYYRIEMFVPAAKREWGYYVCPILEGRRFVGRIEVKADRKASCLNVLGFWPEAGCRWSVNREDKLAAELDRLRRFIGVETVVWQAR